MDLSLPFDIKMTFRVYFHQLKLLYDLVDKGQGVMRPF